MIQLSTITSVKFWRQLKVSNAFYMKKLPQSLAIALWTAESKQRFVLTLFLLSMIPILPSPVPATQFCLFPFTGVSCPSVTQCNQTQCIGAFCGCSFGSIPENHRPLEWAWTGTSGGHLVQSPCSSRANCPGLCPDEFWNSKDEDNTISVGNLCQCLVTVTINKHFLKCPPLVLG